MLWFQKIFACFSRGMINMPTWAGDESRNAYVITWSALIVRSILKQTEINRQFIVKFYVTEFVLLSSSYTRRDRRTDLYQYAFNWDGDAHENDTVELWTWEYRHFPLSHFRMEAESFFETLYSVPVKWCTTPKSPPPTPKTSYWRWNTVITAL
jgi:hypothetical protein